MSFDTVFNYTTAKSELDGQIANFQGLIDAGNASISMYGNISGHENLTTSKIENLTHTNNVYVNMQSVRTAAKTEMEVLEALATEDKNTLYTFWGNVLSNTNETKPTYMKRMMYNHANGLITDAGNVLADGVLTQQESEALAMLICDKYPIVGQTHFIRDSWLA